MTLGELLTVTDVNVQVTVCVEVYGMVFESTHFPKYFMDKQERGGLCEKKIDRIFHRKKAFV